MEHEIHRVYLLDLRLLLMLRRVNRIRVAEVAGGGGLHRVSITLIQLLVLLL